MASRRCQLSCSAGGTVCGHVQDHLGRLAAGVTLHFQDWYSYGTDAGNGRFATAVTDENGYYEVSHLPERLVFIHRADEWDALGVVRQTVLPSNGKRRTVDFGGSSKITGQLFVNGKPLSNQKNPDLRCESQLRHHESFCQNGR